MQRADHENLTKELMAELQTKLRNHYDRVKVENDKKGEQFTGKVRPKTRKRIVATTQLVPLHQRMLTGGALGGGTGAAAGAVAIPLAPVLAPVAAVFGALVGGTAALTTSSRQYKVRTKVVKERRVVPYKVNGEKVAGKWEHYDTYEREKLVDERDVHAGNITSPLSSDTDGGSSDTDGEFST